MVHWETVSVYINEVIFMVLLRNLRLYTNFCGCSILAISVKSGVSCIKSWTSLDSRIIIGYVLHGINDCLSNNVDWINYFILHLNLLQFFIWWNLNITWCVFAIFWPPLTFDRVICLHTLILSIISTSCIITQTWLSIGINIWKLISPPLHSLHFISINCWITLPEFGRINWMCWCRFFLLIKHRSTVIWDIMLSKWALKLWVFWIKNTLKQWIVILFLTWCKLRCRCMPIRAKFASHGILKCLNLILHYNFLRCNLKLIKIALHFAFNF